MALKSEPPKFQDTVTVDFLQQTLLDHRRKVEELALSELHSLELPLPYFNSLTVLSKYEFSKLMGNVKRTMTDPKSFVVTVAVICDTLTCFIQGKKFYDNYATDNSYILTCLIRLLKIIQKEVMLSTEAFEDNQLQILIEILRKSSERIWKESSSFSTTITEIIDMLKTLEDYKTKNICHELTNSLKENDQHIKSLKDSCIKNNTKSTCSSVNGKVLQASNKTTSKIADSNNLNLDSKVLNSKVLQASNKTTSKIADSNITSAKLNPDSKKPVNAFQLMMKSSKMIPSKKKRKI